MSARSVTPTPSGKHAADVAPPAPHSSRFFDKSPQMAISRKTYLQILVGGSVSLVFIIFAIFSIYWGALWKTPAHALAGVIVDFDNADIGQVVTQGLLQVPPVAITWKTLPSSDFPDGPNQVADYILKEKAWVAVVVNSDATTRLNQAATSPNADYSGAGAVTVYAVEARSENGFRSLIRPTVQQSLSMISQRFARQFATRLSTSSNLSQLLSTSPQVLTEPLSYTLDNMRPFDKPVATAVTFVGLIYLLIMSFFIVMIGLSAREAAGLDRHLSTLALIRLRLGSVLIVYFFISLFYSLLSLAFGMDFSRAFGKGGFIVFWMLNWVGMLSVGLALEAMITLLTIRFMPFFMILWIIVNVSVCFFPIEVLPRIFHYGYAMPFYNVSRGVRIIVFNTKNTLGMNFGILIAWAVLSMITLSFIQWFVRRGDVAKIEQDTRESEETKVEQ